MENKKMTDKFVSGVPQTPLELKSQEKAKADGLPCVKEGKLKTYDPKADNPKKFINLLKTRITRELVVSMTACVHCGLCTQSCHYYLMRPDDPTMTPVWKADQIRKIFKRRIDWTGQVFPRWVGACEPEKDEDLIRLKNIVFGSCSACRRCSYNCPMGVDTALLVRMARGILVELGVVPEGVFNVSRDEWETGNQMAVTKEDYLDTLAWMRDDLREELGTDEIDIPVDKPGVNVMYTINPREIKFDPRSIANAAKVFFLAGESWTMPSWGWDQTNFGLFSGDDKVGGYIANNLYESAEKLGVKKIIISECGHGYRSSRWEGYNWAKRPQTLPTESVIITLERYLKEGRIKVDPSRNTLPVTFHDSCNIARSGDMVEQPRRVLKQVLSDFREMYPNRQENYCCTGGGGLLSMAEYKPLRMEVARLKAEQLQATGAKLVCTICHNCIDGLSDVIKHYKLDMKVVQVLDLVASALVIPDGLGKKK